MTAENVKKRQKTGEKTGLGDRGAPFRTGWARLSRTCEIPVSRRRCFAWGPPSARDFFALFLPLAVVGVHSGGVVFCKFSGATPDGRFCPPFWAPGKAILKKRTPKTQPRMGTKIHCLGTGLGHVHGKQGSPARTTAGGEDVSHRGPTWPPDQSQ